MSKKVKAQITRELTEDFKDVEALAVINPRGINAVRTNQIRRRLGEKGLRLRVVKNTLAKRALADGRLKGFEILLDGPSALVYGKAGVKAGIATIARLLLAEKKLYEQLELRGAFFDGEVYAGEKGIEKVSKFPTREEALARLVASLLGPGRKLAGTLPAVPRKMAGILKAIEEKAKVTEAQSAPAPVVAAAAAEASAPPAT